MGFLWEGSTGARAVKFLRAQDQGFAIDTDALARALNVKAGALYQLLANAVKLRYIKKVHGPGQSIRWKLGAGGGDMVTIERRRPVASLTRAEIACRRALNDRRRQRAELSRTTRSERSVDGAVGEAAALGPLPAWLGGTRAPLPIERPGAACKGGGRPAAYLARWHVLYRDARVLVHGDIQVQAVHANLGVIDAWCEARGGVDRFALSGFARVADAETGDRVDVQTWLEAPPRARKRKLASAEV